MASYKNITTIAFDADDTLWLNEPLFQQTQEECRLIVEKYVADHNLEEKLYEAERRNLELFGYGVKGFTLSMIETVIELTEEQISVGDIQSLIELGKNMLVHPVKLLDGVEKTLKGLRDRYDLWLITKGDLFDQESKVARSGVADFFQHIEIVSEKNEETYEAILKRYQIPSSRFLMIGNSLKSDILPVCKIGGHAIHVPYHTTWVHEQLGEKHLNGIEYMEVDRLDKVLTLLGR